MFWAQILLDTQQILLSAKTADLSTKQTHGD